MTDFWDFVRIIFGGCVFAAFYVVTFNMFGTILTMKFIIFFLFVGLLLAGPIVVLEDVMRARRSPAPPLPTTRTKNKKF